MINKSLKSDLEYTYNSLSQTELNKLKDSTILVTGCGGFLGYYFMKFFEYHAEKLGIKKVIGLDNFMLGFPTWVEELEKNPIFSIKKFNIITDKIENIEHSEKVDYIIHMASIASPVFYRQ